MENLAVKLSDQPIDRSAGRRLFQPRDFQSIYASLPTLQLDQADIQQVGILSAQPEGDGVDNAGSRSAGFTFKERNAPAMLRTVGFQRVLACGLGCVGFCEGAHEI